jgi:RHS repeat-associated protein
MWDALCAAISPSVPFVRKRLVTTTFQYDNNGNVIQKTTDGTTTTYIYDYLNHLTAPGSAGATTTYSYDAFGARILQTGTFTTTFYPFKWYSVASSTGTGAKYATTTSYVFNGDTLLATVDQLTASGVAIGTAKTRYVHPDHLGSTNVVTDENDNVVQTLDYYPYGATRVSVATSTNEKRKFIGQFADDSTLSYLGARYYSSDRGQFITQDPIFWNQKQNLQDPQSLNPYSYAEDNPITGKDPDGLALTASQNTALNSIKAQLQAILVQLSSFASSGGGFQSVLNSIQQSVSSAGAAISRIAVGGGATNSPGFHWSPPLAQSNPVTDYHAYTSGNGISATPGGNDPTGGNLMLTALTFTPLGEFGPDEIRGASALKIFIDHEHSAQHLEEMGISRAAVDSAIRADIAKQGPGPVSTFVSRTINVAGKQVEYHPWTLPNGIINVGTYFIRQ